MSCEPIRSLFSDHLDGALSTADEDRLGAHLAECAACRAALARFETHLQALSGAAPLPPPDLRARTLAAARRERLLRRRGLLLPLAAAASVAVFAGGYGVGRRQGPPGPATFTAMELPSACSPERVPRLDRQALRVARQGPPERRLAAAGRSLRLPASLLSHGPYDTQPAQVLGAGACLPLTAAYGDALVLVVMPAPARAPVGEFVVEPDPRRVLYTRVRWTQSGVAFSLEGRAEARELLELAQEIAGRAGVDAG
jgi:hypothetical protein